MEHSKALLKGKIKEILCKFQNLPLVIKEQQEILQWNKTLLWVNNHQFRINNSHKHNQTLLAKENSQ